jgi:hypothetical protein
VTEDDVMFWSARTELAHIYTYAQSRAVGPWGVLGSVLARAICAVPPHVTLPPIVGGAMSLNLFVGLVGVSGLGKGASDAVGREAVTFRYAGQISAPAELPTGSGEGIARSFRQANAGPDDDAPDTVIFHAAEVDSLAAIGRRQGSTFEPESRKLYSGEALGFANAQKETRTRVAAHSYRAALIVGVQPARSESLFQGADGGTPQRFLWFPVSDPTAPDQPPETPNTKFVDVPMPSGHSKWSNQVDVPIPIASEILRHRRAMLRGEDVDPLNGHRLLAQLKVAAALAVLDGNNRDHLEVTDDDWRLASHIMAVSDITREQCRRTVEEKAKAANRARAHATADREEVITGRKHDRAKRSIRRWLEKLRDGDNMARNELRRKLKADVRQYFDPALAELIEEGHVQEIALPSGEGYTIGTRVPAVHPDLPAETGVSQRDTCPPHPPLKSPIGAPTANTPGMSDRVIEILNRQRGVA